MLATATERLCVDSEANQLKFLKAQIVEVLLSVITKHEKNAAVVGESFRALVTLSSVRPCPQKIRTEESFRIYVHGLRVHDKSEYVARWGCNLIYSCAVDDHSRMILGSNRACEAVIVALQKHSNQSAVAALWGCKALVALSVLDSNKSRFINSETCVAVVKALEAHQDDAASSEWVCAAVVSLGASESNRLKLNGACSALCQVLKKQMATSEIVTRLACEAIYELCVEEINRQSFAAAGASELLVHNLNTHMHDVKVSQQVCRAIAGFSNVPVNSTDFSNPTSLGANGCCQALFVTMRTHSFSPPLIEWACASIAAVTDRNATNQSIFLDMVSKDSTMNIFKLITFLLSTHRTHLGVCYQACRAVRSLCQANVKMVREFSAVGIVPVTMKVLKTHKGVDNIVEFACWMLTYIVAPEFAPEDEYNPTLSPSQSQANLIDLDTAIVSQPSVTTTDSSAAVVDSGAVPISEISTKVPQIATSRKSSPSRGVTNLLPIASAPRSATTIPNSFDLYRDRSNWEVLLQALQTNMLKPIVARWICAAISVFADIGKLSHLELCDSVLTMLTRHMDKDYVLMRGLQAVGKLADCHPDNKVNIYTSSVHISIISILIVDII